MRASRRSSGFTHYFAIKTILYAREKEFEAQSRILLFDEPGIFLHPAGQFDLLRVMETLSRTNQVAYVTHSLFMLDKNHPNRHRLISKGNSGTVIDGKPFTARWSRALSALGVTLSGTILFANHVLLTEGDSDPVYIMGLLSALNTVGDVSVDINSLAVIATGESKHTDSLIRMLTESAPKPQIALLVDGDKGGERRRSDVQQLLSNNDVKVLKLSAGTTIEDHLIGVHDILIRAMAVYAAQLAENLKGKTDTVADYERVFSERFAETHGESKSYSGIGSWAVLAIQEALSLQNPASKVGLAREYIAQLASTEVSTTKASARTRAKKLATTIQEMLGLPTIESDDGQIITTTQ